jgi:hypothetical protein
VTRRWRAGRRFAADPAFDREQVMANWHAAVAAVRAFGGGSVTEE